MQVVFGGSFWREASCCLVGQFVIISILGAWVEGNGGYLGLGFRVNFPHSESCDIGMASTELAIEVS